MPLTIQNNYSKLKADFKADTGLDADQEIATYIAYFNARMNDKTYQISHFLTESILNELRFLPDKAALRIGEMLKSMPK